MVNFKLLQRSLEMDAESVMRLMNVMITPNDSTMMADITMQYPAIFRTTCIMDITGMDLMNTSLYLTPQGLASL